MNSVTNITPAGLNPSEMGEIKSLMKTAIAAGTVLDAVQFTELKHSFIPGGYARQLWRPAGTLIVGKIHKHECFNFLMTGRMSIWSEDERKDILAPFFWSSAAGSRRVTYAHEDSLLITVHPTNETDLGKIEAELVFDEPDDVGLSETINQYLGEI